MISEELIKKYNIVHIDGLRYYKIDLSVREYNFENTIPYCFSFKGSVLYDSSWKGIIPKIVNELDEAYHKPTTELLEIKNDWSKQCVFSEKKVIEFYAI